MSNSNCSSSCYSGSSISSTFCNSCNSNNNNNNNNSCRLERRDTNNQSSKMSKIRSIQKPRRAMRTTTNSKSATMKTYSLFRYLLTVSISAAVVVQGYYSNVTLKSRTQSLQTVVYLPPGIHSEEDHYYLSTRFEHGSMIGPITRTSLDPHTRTERKHTFYGTELWKQPHNSNWPESGAGLASEFGVGDDGAFCFYRCGWYGIDDVTNGVLGYREAKVGEPFLKIGVGALVKGSCQSCDSTDDYKFNSPYRFAELPMWHLIQVNEDSLVLEHEAHLTTSVNYNNNLMPSQSRNSQTHYGYRLRKDISLHEDELLITSTLTNLGDNKFATAWYSHHFFTCDGYDVSQKYSLRLDMNGDHIGPLYEEPGVIASWAQPLSNFGTVTGSSDKIEVDMFRHVEAGTRIKAEFVRDDDTNGAFTLRGCDTLIREEIPQLRHNDPFGDGLSMYAYNLYIEKGTFSPEPQVLIHLEPGQSKSWTQKIIFEDDFKSSSSSSSSSKVPFTAAELLSANVSETVSVQRGNLPVMIVVGVAMLLFISLQAITNRLRHRRRNDYTQIPNDEQQQQPQP